MEAPNGQRSGELVKSLREAEGVFADPARDKLFVVTYPKGTIAPLRGFNKKDLEAAIRLKLLKEAGTIKMSGEECQVYAKTGTILKDDDVFHRMDFASEEQAVSKAPLQLKQKLEEAAPPSWVERVEVYQNGPSEYFYNGTALLLSQGYGIEVPTKLERAKVTRKQLFATVGITEFIKWP
jgi:hypothetical protein